MVYCFKDHCCLHVQSLVYFTILVLNGRYFRLSYHSSIDNSSVFRYFHCFNAYLNSLMSTPNACYGSELYRKYKDLKKNLRLFHTKGALNCLTLVTVLILILKRSVICHNYFFFLFFFIYFIF